MPAAAAYHLLTIGYEHNMLPPYYISQIYLEPRSPILSSISTDVHNSDLLKFCGKEVVVKLY